MSDPNEPKKETVRIPLPPASGTTSGEQASEAHDTARINLSEDPPTDSPAAPQAEPIAPPKPRRAIQTLSAGAVGPPPLKPSRSPSPPTAPPAATPEAREATPTSGLTEPTVPAALPAMPPRPRVLPPPPRVAPPVSAPGSISAAPSNYPGSGAHAGPRKETARIASLPEKTAPPAPAMKMTKTQPLMRAPVAKIQSAPVTVAASTPTGLDAIPLPICWTIFGISSVTLLIQIWNYLAS